MVLELHFQEGFCGEDVEIIIGGRVVARLRVETRLQTGLAHIEKLLLSKDQQEVQITIAELGQVRSVRAADVDTGSGADVKIGAKVDGKIDGSEQEYVLINLRDRQLIIQPTKTAPGYL